MWFKHLSFYRLPKPWTLNAAALEQRLAQRPLTPCPAASLASTGWVPPAQDAALVQGQEGHLLIALGTEQRLLPGSVIRDAAAIRAQEYERTKGFKPGRKALREIREVVAAELLPRAFTRRSSVRAWIDTARSRLVVDTAAPARAEWLLQHLRDSLDGLEAELPSTPGSPAAILTAWAAAGEAPGNFSLEDECELSGRQESRPVIRYLRHPLVAGSLRRHAGHASGPGLARAGEPAAHRCPAAAQAQVPGPGAQPRGGFRTEPGTGLRGGLCADDRDFFRPARRGGTGFRRVGRADGAALRSTRA
jgi:recombination associated protein RdgC